MTSWKRLFGKKTKKAHRKLEQKYDQWLENLHASYGPQSAMATEARSVNKNRNNNKRESHDWVKLLQNLTYMRNQLPVLIGQAGVKSLSN